MDFADLPTHLTITEDRVPGLLRRGRVLVITLEAEDIDAFKPRYEAFSRALEQWYGKRGKRCAGVRIHALIHPWIGGRVRDYVKRLREIPAHAALRHMPLTLILTGTDGAPVDGLELPPEDH
ncbi:hypothetical protein [Isoalcanivorax indicus]|uniref:hypothetical protein n=1 Tax=Isoalcanivorax indicus TaxID=2202653 RepID=UPI000DBAC1EA|nr:hypothetical protein [Isoalcanivorax indicus]